MSFRLSIVTLFSSTIPCGYWEVFSASPAPGYRMKSSPVIVSASITKPPIPEMGAANAVPVLKKSIPTTATTPSDAPVLLARMDLSYMCSLTLVGYCVSARVVHGESSQFAPRNSRHACERRPPTPRDTRWLWPLPTRPHPAWLWSSHSGRFPLISSVVTTTSYENTLCTLTVSPDMDGHLLQQY